MYTKYTYGIHTLDEKHSIETLFDDTLGDYKWQTKPS